MVSSIKENKTVNIWKNASRNLLDVTDLYLAVSEVLKEEAIANEVVNLANTRSFLIPEIVIEIEKFLNKKAIVNVKDKGTLVDIDISRTEEILNHVMGVDNKVENYIEVLLKKYFDDEK
jgi:nucleoside-diphosphate-sugar epimerase